ncbi:selenide, water dikinase [Fundidesulfovibrio butyratiphilus]
MQGLEGPTDERLLTGRGDNEDAAILRFPPGKALVQTVDFFTPIVNDPYRFGQIAAANALSDVYAMGAVPLAAMNILCFPSKRLSADVLRAILEGGLSKISESGALLAGGHTVEDDELKYGLSVSGVADPEHFATNRGLVAGDFLLLTKPLGIGVLATAVKARMPDADEHERVIWETAARLNRVGGQIIAELKLRAATDITGFGLGGHLLEMSKASGLVIEIDTAALPLLPDALNLAAMGLVPAGSHANTRYFAPRTLCAPGLDPLRRDLVFDAQTSGGLILAVPEGLLSSARELLVAGGELANVVGRVTSAKTDTGMVMLL